MKSVLSIFLLISSFGLYSQKEILKHPLLYGDNPPYLYADSLYKDRQSHLMIEKIVQVPNKTQKEIHSLIKEWGGLNFRSLKDVITSESDGIITMVFVKSGIISYDWYVRSVIQIKDGRFRIQLYDDGNCFIGGLNVQERTYHLDFFFNNDVLKSSRKINGMLMFYDSLTQTVDDLRDYTNNKTSGKSNDDW
jgi:hypothetical protein